jgi:hypothetical protein
MSQAIEMRLGCRSSSIFMQKRSLTKFNTWVPFKLTGDDTVMEHHRPQQYSGPQHDVPRPPLSLQAGTLSDPYSGYPLMVWHSHSLVTTRLTKTLSATWSLIKWCAARAKSCDCFLKPRSPTLGQRKHPPSNRSHAASSDKKSKISSQGRRYGWREDR